MQNPEQSSGLPKALEKLASQLLAGSEEANAFLTSFRTGKSGRSVVLLPEGSSPPPEPDFQAAVRPAFQPAWAVPLEHCPAVPLQGYQMDLSSVFLAAPLFELAAEKDLSRVLDLCSSPGGKAILAARILKPGRIGCNETIDKRIPALISNLKRFGITGVEVYSRDPGFFSAMAKDVFDLVMVDAPCSGQSLYGTGDVPSGVFHQTLVRKNALRQRRILAEAAVTVRPGGFLLYMTCTFSLEENEKVLEWFLKSHADYTALPVSVLSGFVSHLSEEQCYRLLPHQGFGRGGFTALLKRGGTGERSAGDQLKPIWRQD